MHLLQSFSILLRNTLIKQHPYFSCCASCGEIKTPLGNRLCTSLSFPYAIDCIIMLSEALEDDYIMDLKKTIVSFQKYCPWIQKLTILSKMPLSTPLVQAPTDSQEKLTIECLLEKDVVPQGAHGCVEAYAHTISNLSEYFLVVSPRELPEHTLHPLDFYTPNGIPLVKMAKHIDSHPVFLPPPPMRAYTKESAACFLQALQASGKELACKDYYPHYAQWAYDNQTAILATSD